MTGRFPWLLPEIWKGLIEAQLRFYTPEIFRSISLDEHARPLRKAKQLLLHIKTSLQILWYKQKRVRERWNFS